ncbi:unnamed protein product [Bursaphelenchus xylophilus]|uniref:(pine wood nematode) hypothetical protein n=1 Tax=Bursaphelenchus xylophilus TaxID=6326 RepID=A0A1I7S854_BURXY|nr:unnamed protein product [Bursaphelenchus xylophilus]CAG9080555.1 unnamed protein product [Bursaphelenchus xylophilus]
MDYSRLSVGSGSDESVSRKRPLDRLMVEEIEPYVRRKKGNGDRAKKRLENLNEEEQNVLRTCINSRERKRMHDLNEALDDLRSVLPQQQAATARKLSKISTIILATNHIRQQTEHVRLLMSELRNHGIETPPEPQPLQAPVSRSQSPVAKADSPKVQFAATPTPALPLAMPFATLNPVSLMFLNQMSRICMRHLNPTANCQCPQCFMKVN